MAKFDIVALGESLIDFVSLPGKDPTKIYMEGNAGGAPANVLAAAAKLGRSTSFIGKVGQDAFGTFLCQRIGEAGVDTSAIIRAKEPTTLAVVTLDEKGNRSFGFYRTKTADVMLQESDLDTGLIEGCRILHFGTLSMTDEPAYSATLAGVKRAKQAGVAISFDPNFRPVLWDSKDDAIAAMKTGIELADYVKVSDEEAEMLTGESDPEKAALALCTTYGLSLAAVTLGPKGCVGITTKARVKLPTYDVPCVDTTGAGDAFWGAALHRLLAYRGSGGMDEKNLTALLQYCNAAGSIATMKHGAIPSLATEEEILRCMETEPLLILD